MEVWDLYDNKGQKLHKTINRGDEVPSGSYHLVPHIIIKDSNDNFLIQKRAANKRILPDIWDFTGGCAQSGESSVQAAYRELAEETSIVMEKNELRCIKRIFRGSQITDIWFGRYDVDVTTLKFQVEEVSALKFTSMDEIKEMINLGLFYAYEDEYLNEVFKI